MARGDQLLSPYLWNSGGDVNGLMITVAVYFNDSTRALANTAPGGGCVVVHRDSGCEYNTLVFGKPVLDDGTPDPNAPRLPAPADGAADSHYTVAQVKSASKKQLGFPNGWQTIEDVLSTQITAEF